MRRPEAAMVALLLTLCLWCVFSEEISYEIKGSSQNESSTTANSTREGKIFSLFTIVQFSNSGCKSQSLMHSGQSLVRNGTCFTASECASKGGVPSGNCAAGFGVCCLFLVSASGGVINQNCTYIRNPGFPGAYSVTASVSYKVQKCSSDICWLRLDFESFQILGPSSTSEPNGGSCPDTFVVTTTPFSYIPTICGLNTGHHVYIDMGNVATDSSTLAFTFTGTSTTRTWEIKVSQITCSNPARPPQGCLQYYTTLTGRITTFNFQSTTSSHLANQDQNVCIRQFQGYCCIQYQVCSGQTNAWSLDRTEAFATATAGMVDSSCSQDYTAIPGSSFQCSRLVGSQFSKYCGWYLRHASYVDAKNLPVCDCTAPFTVTFHTDAISDAQNAIPGTPASRGVCLDYEQMSCPS